ncbi:baseplate J/gp47 family protein [Archangium lansingense]|uniref:Baseplate J/gp47 family protein n=1 Tax=Archangium lansingense TaxID=2995310 RepID=A0ABT4AAL2_9BACT|nr:baseplate J/gp47 family protein [Archangium lansinium]MCY1078706.1 baseplate J/gp47 family protein [Archangium lansinium]
MNTPGDRRQALRQSTTLNGIDFIRVDATQTKLEVHFLNPVPGRNQLRSTVKDPRISGGDAIPTVPVRPITDADWSQNPGEPPVLTLRVPAPGDFSQYTLSLGGELLDPFFSRATFSFKANCDSRLDCEQPPEECALELPPPPPIDYLAKDFASFRKALSDFSAQRHPEWQERSEADFGVMFLESLSSLADDLSYLQDRIAAEASLDTATQRRSLVRHARLVDYEPRPIMTAQAWLWLEVTKSGPLPAGLPVSALGPDGERIDFETGRGLADTQTYPVDPRWNPGKLEPYAWDDSERCLPAGATELWLQGDGLGLFAEQWLLIDTEPRTGGNESIRALVRLTEIQEGSDPLFGDTKLTRVSWRAEDALARDHDLTRTHVRGNLVPVTQGRRFRESFIVEGAPSGERQSALVRTGLNGTPQVLFPLAQAPLAWHPSSEDADSPAQPELSVVRQDEDPPEPWSWQRSLLDAGSFETVFTVDPIRYRPVGLRHPDGTVSMDYDGDGETLRFGDGVFGEMPDEGAVFEVTYRTSVGAAGNVAADSITLVDPNGPLGEWATQAGNPFPAEGGADAESAESVRRLAPEAFRARRLNAVRPEDYDAAAESLPWVQRAGTVARYTGSWHTVFTAVDPLGSEVLAPEQHLELAILLGRRRIAGHEVYTSAPRYVSLDLEVFVCARPEAFQGDVEEAVLEVLSDKRLRNGRTGFFHVDRFSFGTPLERSVLEKEIQLAHGVAGVRDVRYRRRGFTAGLVALPETLTVGTDEILRVDNNPSRPERGSIKVIVEGGK